MQKLRSLTWQNILSPIAAAVISVSMKTTGCPSADVLSRMICPVSSGNILEADGYIMACPVYDFTVTAVMKAFIERRFPMFYKTKGAIGIPDARVKQNFKEKGSADCYRKRPG